MVRNGSPCRLNLSCGDPGWLERPDGVVAKGDRVAAQRDTAEATMGALHHLAMLHPFGLQHQNFSPEGTPLKDRRFPPEGTPLKDRRFPRDGTPLEERRSASEGTPLEERRSASEGTPLEDRRFS